MAASAVTVPSPEGNKRSPRMRQLKRDWSVMYASGEDGKQARSTAAEGTPLAAAVEECLGLPATVPRLPFTDSKSSDALMDPPSQPPRRKRALLTSLSGGSACSSTIAVNPGAESLPPLPAASTPRVLTPRVSWSEICRSQESLEDASQDMSDARPVHTPPRGLRQQSSIDFNTPVIHRRQQAFSPQRAGPRRRRPQSDDEAAGDDVEGRFAREFCEITAIGSGQFSTVFKAKHRIDQRFYAVKKTTRITSSLSNLQNNSCQMRLREVFALSAIAVEAANCPHIVRYFCSWLEDCRLHIQTELCDCSLRDVLLRQAGQSDRDPHFSAPEIGEVLAHVASGLAVLHGKGYVHLDIKPDNILVSSQGESAGKICYKIADLGLAAAALSMCCDDICEGDCRYLAREVLRGDLSNLPKADVFSLGVLVFELATNPRPLPCSGDEWQLLRDGQIDANLLKSLPEKMTALLRLMIHPSPVERVPCEEIIQHPAVHKDDGLEFYPKGTLEARTKEAERNRKRADDYWHELVSMKRQELLGGGGVGKVSEASVDDASITPASFMTAGPRSFAHAGQRSSMGQISTRCRAPGGNAAPPLVTCPLRRGYTA